MTHNKLHKIAWCRTAGTTGESARLRRAVGLTIGDVAAEVGVHPVTLRRWETGASTPNASAALRWFEVLHSLAGIEGIDGGGAP